MGVNEEVEEEVEKGPLRLAEILPITLTIGGALLYGALSVADSRFYEQLGTNPEDVGLSYTTTLVRSIGFISIVTAILAPSAYLLLRTSPAQRAAARTARVPFYQRLISDAQRRQRSIALLTTVTLLVSFLVTVLILSLSADSRAHAVQRGKPVESVKLLGLTILPIRAETSDVSWLDLPQKPSLPRRMLYLGQSAGTAVFYDPSRRMTLFLPAAELAIAVG
jgi:hypothetical protein